MMVELFTSFAFTFIDNSLWFIFGCFKYCEFDFVVLEVKNFDVV